MFRYILSLTFLALLVSCQNNTNQSVAKYYEDGRARPTVALVPVVDSTSFHYPWSLSEEFSSMIANLVNQKKTLYMPSEGVTSFELSYDKNLFDSDLSWIKKEFSTHEFVVLVEFLNHEKVPLMKRDTPIYELSANLEMCVRVRIVDLRKQKPQIVLQEKITDSFFFSKNLLPVDYQQVTWGMEEYDSTPLATAHMQIAEELVGRINDYILLAKSR